MALHHKWDVKNDFAFVLNFFSLIFDGLGGVGTRKCPLGKGNKFQVMTAFKMALCHGSRTM